MAKKQQTRTEVVTDAEVKRVPLHLIKLNPEFDVRPEVGKVDPTVQQASLTELADSIQQNGQILPGAALAVPAMDDNGQPIPGKEDYILIDGHRRMQAITINYNAGIGPDVMDLKIFRGDSPADAFRKAFNANVQREDMSPIQIAYDIEKARKQLGQSGDANAGAYSKVAVYLGVAKSTVIKYHKLLQYPADIQADLHDGKLSMSAAEELHKNTLEEQKKAVKELAAQKAAERIAKEKGESGNAPAESAAPGETTEDGTATTQAEAPKESGNVQAQDVVAAARELNAQKEVRPRTRKEIVAFFDSVAESSAFGFLNSPARTFARKFSQYCAGDPKVSEKSVMNTFQELVDPAGEGTPNATEKKTIEEMERVAKEKEAAKLIRQQKKAHKAEPVTA